MGSLGSADTRFSEAFETCRLEVGATDRDFDLVARLDAGGLAAWLSAGFEVERPVDFRVLDRPLLVGVGVDGVWDGFRDLGARDPSRLANRLHFPLR